MEQKEETTHHTLHGVRVTRPSIFPHDITLEDAREAIKFPGFRECEKDDYIGKRSI